MIIGLAGRKLSGKNTVADMITNILTSPHIIGGSYDVEQFSFAHDLKLSVCKLLDIDIAELERLKLRDDINIVEYPNKITMRQFLQRYGTEAHREIFGTNFWVDRTMVRASNWIRVDPNKRIAIITDVRFDNEKDAIEKDKDGIVFQIRRSGENKDTHASESDITLTDKTHVINNYYGLDELEDDVYGKLEKLGLVI